LQTGCPGTIPESRSAAVDVELRRPPGQSFRFGCAHDGDALIWLSAAEADVEAAFARVEGIGVSEVCSAEAEEARRMVHRACEMDP
jgi:hypothetical protein